MLVDVVLFTINVGINRGFLCVLSAVQYVARVVSLNSRFFGLGSTSRLA